jgi:hypothetical protein
VAAYPVIIKEGGIMAQVIESRFICDGRYRVHSINAVGRHRSRIIEVEDVDRCKRIYDTALKMDRLVLELLRQGHRHGWESPKRSAR